MQGILLAAAGDIPSLGEAASLLGNDAEANLTTLVVATLVGGAVKLGLGLAAIRIGYVALRDRRLPFGVGPIGRRDARRLAGDYRPTPALTENERHFHKRLQQAVGADLDLWPQTSFQAIVQASGALKPAKRAAARGRIAQWRVDWVLARDGQAIAVVELDDRTHDGKGDRDGLRDAILRRCGYTVIRYDSRRKPSPATIREDLERQGVIPPPRRVEVRKQAGAQA